MIPSYNEEVKITVIEQSSNKSLDQEVTELKEQVRKLQETVDYINRERSRMKSEIETLRSQLSRG